MAMSAFLVCMLCLSDVKLSKVIRRLVFGFCLHVLLQSIGTMFSSFLAPKGEALYAIGNVGTCDLQGFLLHVGSTGSLMYNASISLYFVATIKFGYKNNDFRQRLEVWCHLIPNGFAVATGLFLLIKEYFNVGSKSCYIGAKPMYCIYSPYVECERGDEYALQYGLFFSGVPFFIVFFVMFIFTFMIIHSLVLMKQKRERWSLSSGNENESSICFKCLAALVTFPEKLWKLLFERNTENTSPKFPIQMQSSGPKRIDMLNVLENDADEENHTLVEDPSSSKTKQASRTSYTRASTKDYSLSSSASVEEEEIQLCPEAQSKIHVAVSRTGNTSDPLAFDLKKVRRSIQAENCQDKKDQVNNNHSSSKARPSFLRQMSALRTSTNTSLSREEESINHSLTYLIGYFLCYTPILIIGLLQMSQTKYPYVLNIISRCLLTLHGPVFLLTYTRPYVRSTRRNHSEYSWFGAFWVVFKAGGDND